MRVWSLIAAFILGLICSQHVNAQNSAPAANPDYTICVVDIGYILNNHPTMKSEMESIQAAMDAAQTEMNAKRDEIMKQMEQLREQYDEGTAEYEAQEKLIAEKDTTFRLELIKKKKEFEKAQANVIYQVYNNISGLLKFFSEQRGTIAFLRVNREKMDPAKPATVDMVMRQEVLYYNPSADITDWVLQALNQTAAKSGNVNR